MNRMALCVLLLYLVGCNQKFYIVETIEKDGTLIFTSRAVKEKCDGPVYFASGFGIRYMGEKDSRVAWEIKRTESIDYGAVESEFPLRYGDELPRFETRITAMPIHPGKYKIATEVVCHSQGGTRGFTLFGTFLVDPNGVLVSSN